LQAKRIIIEPEADLCCHFPLCTEELIIYGQLAATILCKGTVHIHRYGCLEGSVRARGMKVAKYGVYVGDLQISAEEPKESSEIPFKEFPQLKLKRRRSIGESPI
jgi:cytoskeletal protein CcmA (bactofilin family)